MATLTLSEGYRNLKVGEAQELEISRVEFDERKQTAKVTFADAEGGTCTEQFRFGTTATKSKGQEVALNIFSTLAKCALHDWQLTEIDPLSIQGQLVVADVFQQEVVNEETGRSTFYTHVKNFHEAEVV